MTGRRAANNDDAVKALASCAGLAHSGWHEFHVRVDTQGEASRLKALHHVWDESLPQTAGEKNVLLIWGESCFS